MLRISKVGHHSFTRMLNRIKDTFGIFRYLYLSSTTTASRSIFTSQIAPFFEMWTIRGLVVLCVLTALSCSSRTKLAHGFIVESPRAFVPNGATLGRLASTRQCPPKGHHNLKGRSVPARETKLSLHTGLLQETLSVPISSSTVESSLALSALPTFDPTTALSDVLGAVLNTPLILAIPIVAALLVATLIAYLIVAYAQPAEDE
jgi:hypothetical protein